MLETVINGQEAEGVPAFILCTHRDFQALLNYLIGSVEESEERSELIQIFKDRNFMMNDDTFNNIKIRAEALGITVSKNEVAINV